MSAPCDHGLDTGAYVLGALDDHERRRFEEHLNGCETCRREVAELRAAATALPLAADPVAPPPELRERIMDVVRREAGAREDAPRAAPRARARPAWWRRVRLPALGPLPAAVAACALLALGVAGGVVLGGGGEDAREVRAQVALAGASGMLRIEDDGARLALRGMPAPPEGRVYQVWLLEEGGAPTPTDALFVPRGDGSASVGVPGDVDAAQQVLVTAEPRGGSRRPTSDPVIMAAVRPA